MKILFIIHAVTGGGAERVMATLINEYASKGNSVSLLTDTSTSFAYNIHPNVHLFDLTKDVYKIESVGVWKICQKIRKLYNIRKTVNIVKPDVVISFICELNCEVIFSLLFKKVPIICSEHINVNHKFPSHYLLMRNILYPFASAITVLTKHDYKLWKNKFNNVVYMPNPINIGFVSRKERKNNIIAVGRLSAWTQKGFDNLILCWSKLCHKYSDWHLQIIGDGDSTSVSYLQKLANDANCKNLDLLGFRRDVKEIMEESAIFCLSSRYEGLPMVLIEAMEAGCCCVAYDCETGPNEIIINNKNGLLVKNQDKEDLIRNLENVMSDSFLRKSLSDSAPAAVKRYSTERIVNRWNILVNKLTK